MLCIRLDKGKGFGGQLIANNLNISKDLALNRMILVGDLSYYRRLGFSRLTNILMPLPANPQRVLRFGDWNIIVGSVEKS